MSEKDLEKLFVLRQKLLDRQQTGLIRKVGLLEKKIYEAIVNALIEQLRVSDGVIVSGKTELKLSEAIDRIFDAFAREQLQSINKMIASDFAAGLNLNAQYYQTLYTLDGRKGKFLTIKRAVYKEMRKRIGIGDRGQVISGGYLDRLIKNVPLRAQVKHATFKAVTSGKPMKEFQKSLKVMIQGSRNVDGSLTKYYKGFVYDTYITFDRITNTGFAKRLGLTDFVYDGGLIETSRRFCIKKNDKLFNVDQAQAWKDDPDLPRTTAEKESGVLIDYDPVNDMGRWRCRHLPRYISKQMAERLR